MNYIWLGVGLLLVLVGVLVYENYRLRQQLQKTTKALEERNKAIEDMTEMFQRAMNAERQRKPPR